jgi:hypothetical protein
VDAEVAPGVNGTVAVAEEHDVPLERPDRERLGADGVDRGDRMPEAR